MTRPLQFSDETFNGGGQGKKIEPCLGKNENSVAFIHLDYMLMWNMKWGADKRGPWPVPVASTRMCTRRSPQRIFLSPSDGVMGRGANGPEADIPSSIKRVDLGRKCKVLFRRCSLNAFISSNLTHKICRPERRFCIPPPNHGHCDRVLVQSQVRGDTTLVRDRCPSTSAATNSPPSQWKALGASERKAAIWLIISGSGKYCRRDGRIVPGAERCLQRAPLLDHLGDHPGRDLPPSA